MRKYVKNLVVILVGVLIATNSQIVTPTHALEDNANQTKLDTNIEGNVHKVSNYAEDEIAEVKTAKELSLAAKDINIKLIDIKRDIVLTTPNENYYEIFINGNGKEIRGNGYTISGKMGLYGGALYIYTNTKIDNLKLDGIRIDYRRTDDAESINVELINKSELKDSIIYTYSREYNGNVFLENANIIVLKKTEKSNKENPLELYIDGDIKQKGDTYTIKAEKEGTYSKVYYNDTKLEKIINKKLDAYYSTKNREGNKPTFTINELTGKDRYQTAVNISNEGWDKADNVVIVNSDSMVDALSATPFDKSNDAPILLTESNGLNSETRKELLRLKPTHIYVIGGESSVSYSVIIDLFDITRNVNRIGGNDRYETSLKIAKVLGDVSEIAVVNGIKGLPDAVSIAPVAADKTMPIVLASPNEGTKVFDQYIKDNNITKSYVIGREGSISNEIANKLPSSERVGGINRNETNAAILDKFYTSEELENIYVAKDGMKKTDDLIDALAVGVLAAKEKSPVVIVGNDLYDKQASSLSKKQPLEITKVGGNGNENAFNKLVSMFKK